MWLEIIISLLLGGLFYVLVCQENSKPTKSFKVTDRKRTRTVLLKYNSFESFSERCKTKFDLGQNEKLQFSSSEDQNIELDEECIDDLEDKSLLIIKGETDASIRNNTDDSVGSSKFDLGQSVTLEFTSGEKESIELDKRCKDDLENKSSLIIKEETDASGPKDDDDDNDGVDGVAVDDCLERDILGSDRAGTERAVDNADTKRCEDIQDESDILGSDSAVAETAADNADLKTSEDIQELELLGLDTAGWEIIVDNADIKKWEDLEKDGGVKEHILKFGLKNMTSVLKQNITDWKTKPINIAVTGESGKGKSSFINAFLGLYPGQEGAADVDEEECTTKCREFRHPKYDSFVLWDVPGVGTNSFPKENYFRAIEVDRFDFFMIISCSRFSKLESWLAKEILEMKKRLYFIRTKIDIDMSNKKNRFKNRGQDFCEKEEFDKMKTDISQKLNSDLKVAKLPFFVISNNHPDKYDFPLILNKLLQDVPAEKNYAMVFGLTGISENIIEEKASALRSRIWKVALLSGLGAGIPLPFVSTGIDAGLINQEARFYIDQFGLDDQSLTHLADMAGTSLDDLKRSVDFKTLPELLTSTGLNKNVLKSFTRETAEDIKHIIPVVGVPVCCGMSYSITTDILENILESMKLDALKVLMYVATRRTETEID